MVENKTKPTSQSVAKFIDSVSDEMRRKDCKTVATLMRKVTKKTPRMWGDSLIGFGTYHYKYASGHEGDYFVTGFSPRAQNLTVYIMPGFERFPRLMQKLGKYKTGKSCLYIKKLEDVDIAILEELIKKSVQYMEKKYN